MDARQGLPRYLGAVLLVGVGACTGDISVPEDDDPGAADPRESPASGPGRSPSSQPPPDPTRPSDVPGLPGASAAPGAAAGPLALRRLTAVEYDNTVRDLLGDSSAPAGDWSPDVVGDWGFRAARPTSVKEAEELRAAAVRLAGNASAGVDALLACRAGADDAACVSEWVARIGRRAYRRPLATDEVKALAALYAKLRGGEIGFDRRRAVEHVLQAILQSPWFLYRWDVAASPRRAPSGLVELDPHTVATRLSYLLHESMPDGDLDQAADRGALSTPAAVRAQAERLLASPRAHGPLMAFVSQWLHVDRTRVSSESLKRALEDETARLVAHVFVEGDRKLETLLTTSQGFVEEKLAALYGVPAVKGTELRPVSLDPRRRMGILTRAAFLVATGDGGVSVPPKRGAAVYTGLLCGDLPPQPDVPEPEPPNPNVTTRERFEKHARHACATACHALVDPAGFALGNYDGNGRFVETEAGKPIDASGRLPLPSGERLEWSDGPDFLGKLARGGDVKACLARQWFRSLLGRAETPGERAAIDRARAVFDRAGGDMRALVLESVVSEPFLYRSVTAGEVIR